MEEVLKNVTSDKNHHYHPSVLIVLRKLLDENLTKTPANLTGFPQPFKRQA
jgi:hypothetical protein